MPTRGCVLRLCITTGVRSAGVATRVANPTVCACARANSAVATPAAFCARCALLSADWTTRCKRWSYNSLIRTWSSCALVRPPLACELPAVEHPTLQSFLLVPGEIARTFCHPPKDEVQFAVCVALRIFRHHLLVASKFHLSLLPLNLVCLGELGTFLEETLTARVVGLFWISIFLLLHAL